MSGNLSEMQRISISISKHRF